MPTMDTPTETGISLLQLPTHRFRQRSDQGDESDEIASSAGNEAFPPEGVRQRVRGPSSKEGGIASTASVNTAPTFKPIDNPGKGYHKLDFKPFIVLNWVMVFVLAFYVSILALLIPLLFFDDVTFISQYGYFCVKILPPVLGTITTSLWRSTTYTYSRIMPYVLSASGSGDAVCQTILRCYFPIPSIRDAVQTKNILLVSFWIVWILSCFVIPFKSILLSTANQISHWEAIVTRWAVISLIIIYSFMIIGQAVLTWSLWNIRTGLRWDPVSIADHLTLFYHSDFLEDFKGLELTPRRYLYDRLRDKGVRLGYWNRGSLGYWHGFGRSQSGIAESTDRIDKTTEVALSLTDLDSTRHNRKQSSQMDRGTSDGHDVGGVPLEQRSLACYRDVYLNMKYSAMIIWISLAIILFGLILVTLVKRVKSGKQINLSYGAASFLFQFLPVFAVGLYTWFWEDVDLFHRATQPFIGLRKPGFAAENLLLDYNCLPPIIVTYTAITNKHWKVAFVSSMSLLQRLLPIIVAGMVAVIAVDSDSSSSTIYVSLPLSCIALLYLAVYCVAIWYVVRSDGFSRHLPRNYTSIADLVSWCYASSLLHSEPAFDVSKPEESGPMGERWHMESRLRLRGYRYLFGVHPSELDKNTFCLGIDLSENTEEVKPPEASPSIGRALKHFRGSHRVRSNCVNELEANPGSRDRESMSAG
ncbi:MAG: hypothetical protein M1813_008806 [Trichoglossum hirsutum]|nr:MAG: hypothetical protein M1813_008806 [Trichoglossum hirsutum]